MSVPDDLRPEFEAFRDETRRELADLRRETQRRDDVILQATVRSMEALRETQLDHGRTLEEHSAMLRDLTAVTAALVMGQNELREDVAQLRTGQEVLWSGLDEVRADVADLKTDVADLKTDVADLKTDVADLKGGMAEVLRRLPAPPDVR